MCQLTCFESVISVFFFLVYAYLQSKLYIPSDSKILYVYNIILVYFIFSLKASGVNVLCGDKTMTIFIPKTLLRGLDLKNLRLLDTKWKGKEGRTHLSVTTSLTGCKTTSRYTPTAIIYSNTLIIPVATKSAVTRLHDIKVQFSCYYSMHGTVSSLGWTPIKTTLELREKAKGNLTLSLRMFHNKTFENPYTKDDFSVAVGLHRRLFLEVSVATDEKKLSIRADRCYATPTQDQKNSLKYEFIKKGYV